MSAEAEATPPNPKTPATMATTKKINDQFNISKSSRFPVSNHENEWSQDSFRIALRFRG
ncbi:hypothetical protein [Roseovarius aestuariivivens]|uniref:hypothetical protein n=1 Tax=Roseovarius aestuariivivens TaxID=1888910 RepID=UPI001FD8F109|nr:hypothetical protein [Roseovarius aestuariivivens]